MFWVFFCLVVLGRWVGGWLLLVLMLYSFGFFLMDLVCL